MTRVRWFAMWWFPVLAVAAIAAMVLPRANGSIPTPPASGQGTNAKLLYEANCASCHGEDGQGTIRAPSLKGVGEAAVDFYLSTGRMPKRDVGNKPPPYKPYFSPAQIAALDQYVTELAARGGPPVPDVDAARGNVAQGGELFREDCAACHGWGGSGGQLNDRDVPSLTEATPTQIGEAVRVGPSQMPVFGLQALSTRQVDAIAAYMATIDHSDDRGGNPLSHLGPVAEGAVTLLIALPFLLVFLRWAGRHR